MVQSEKCCGHEVSSFLVRPHILKVGHGGCAPQKSQNSEGRKQVNHRALAVRQS